MKEEIEMFAKHLQRRYSGRSTPKHYIGDLKLFQKHVAPKTAAQVTAQDVESFIDDQYRRNLKASTINRRLASLHAFYEHIAWENPDEEKPNPVNWRYHKSKEREPIPRDASDIEVNSLFAVIEDERDRAMFGLMVGAGLRVGEVSTLKMQDLQEEVNAGEMTRLRVQGKGQKERIVWVTPHWMETIRTWLRVRPESRSNTLFLNQHKRPLSVAGIQYRLKQYREKSGVQVSCHQLRHTFSRRLAQQRMPLESISKLLGHSQVETTKRYTAGANPDLQEEFLEAMSRLPETSTAPSTLPQTPIILPPMPPEVADREQLARILTRFDPFPAWLRPFLCDYVNYRWRNWQPHMAVKHAARITSRLANGWQWLLDERHVTAWSTLKRSDIEAWLTYRTEAGITPLSRSHDLSTLRSFLFFVLDHEVELSPNLWRVPHPKRGDPLPRYLDPAAFQRLVSIVLDNTADGSVASALHRAWFLTLAHTGIRPCELLNLRLSDVDLAGGRLIIRHSKNGFGRLVFLTPVLTEALATYLPLRPSLANDHFWLTPSAPLTDRKIRQQLHVWGHLCDVAVTPYRLRHTFATLLINQGVSLEALRKLLGHRTLNMTQRYAHLFDATLQTQFRKAIEQIEGLATFDWPQRTEILELPEISIEQTCDSV